MRKLNNKGYITSLTVVSVMLISLSFLAVFYSTIQTRNVQIGLSENLTEQMVLERTHYDRLYGVFTKDFDRTDDITFPEEGVTYRIKELSRSLTNRVLELTEVTHGDSKETLGTLKIQIKQIKETNNSPYTPNIELIKLN